MRKCYVVMRRDYNGMQETNIVAVFANEGAAEQSAAANKDTTHGTWVEEINFYE